MSTKPTVTTHISDDFPGMAIQPKDFCHKNDFGYMESTSIKYIAKWQKEKKLEDLHSAIHFLKILSKMEQLPK